MKTKKYALVNGNHVRYAELRETPKFLISDSNSDYKFKKIEGKEFIASNSGYRNWSRTGYDVYEVDHPHVLEIIQMIKMNNYVFKVRQKLEKIYMDRQMPFEKAEMINKLLELGVEL